jgi:hypothetical protein
MTHRGTLHRMDPIASIQAVAITRRAVSGAGPRDPVLAAAPSRPVRPLLPKRVGLAFLRLAGVMRAR